MTPLTAFTHSPQGVPALPTNPTTAAPAALRDGANAARELSADVLQSAEEAVENTRNFANHQLDRAHEKLRDLRGNVEPAIDRLAASPGSSTSSTAMSPMVPCRVGAAFTPAKANEAGGRITPARKAKP